MKFKNISIKGFRGLKECKIENLGRVNFFLGQNNSGKSSILEAIFLLTGLNSPQLILSIDIIRQLIHNEANDFRFIFYNLDYESNLEIVGEMFEKDTEYKLKIIPKRENSQIIKKASSSTNSNNPYSTSNLSTENINSLYSVDEYANVIGVDYKAEIKRKHQPRINLDSSIFVDKDDNQADIKQTFDFKSYKPDFQAEIQTPNVRAAQNLNKRLEDIIVDKKKTDLVNSLKIVDSNILDIAAGRNNVIYVDIGAKKLIPANLMGDGFLKFLQVITGMNAVRNGLYLIDEFDNGLHYSTQKGLLKTILRGARDTNTQVFITTHSKESLNYLKEILEDENFFDFRDEVKCYTVSRLKDNTVKAYEYDFASFEYAIDHDVEIRGEF